MYLIESQKPWCAIPPFLTFVAVPDGVAVDVEVLVVEEEETQPRLERVDRNDEQDPHCLEIVKWKIFTIRTQRAIPDCRENMNKWRISNYNFAPKQRW